VNAAALPHFLATPHALALGVWTILTASLVLLGRRLRATPRALSWDRAVGVVACICWLGVNTYWLWPPVRWEQALPLQLCDLAAMMAWLALLTGLRLCRALLYFWAFALSSQGFVTPITREGPDHPEFWAHWINHGAILAAAVYDVAVLRFRPTRRDLILAVGVSLGYVALMVPLNIATGWNYGYVGPDLPESTTILDRLGPWPLRIVWVCLLGALAMVAVYLPWELARVIGLSRGHSRFTSSSGTAAE